MLGLRAKKALILIKYKGRGVMIAISKVNRAWELTRALGGDYSENLGLVSPLRALERRLTTFSSP